METAVRHSHDHRYSLDGHIITRKIFHVNRNLYFLIIIFVYSEKLFVVCWLQRYNVANNHKIPKNNEIIMPCE